MASAQLSIIPFLSKSKDDLAQVAKILPKHPSAICSILRKRPIGSLHYRTRSFRSFKLPRRLKRGTLLKLKLVKKKELLDLETQNLTTNRKRRRRIKAKCYGASADPNIALWDRTRINQNAIRMSTHVWHRKRFIMANRFGVMTAMRSSYHGFKAIDNYYKMGKSFIQDQSYLRIVELCCSQDEFLSIFSHITVRARFCNLYSIQLDT